MNALYKVKNAKAIINKVKGYIDEDEVIQKILYEKYGTNNYELNIDSNEINGIIKSLHLSIKDKNVDIYIPIKYNLSKEYVLLYIEYNITYYDNYSISAIKDKLDFLKDKRYKIKTQDEAKYLLYTTMRDVDMINNTMYINSISYDDLILISKCIDDEALNQKEYSRILYLLDEIFDKIRISYVFDDILIKIENIY